MTDRINVDPTCDNAGCERPPSANARALGKFIEYALTKPAVRFVTYSDLIGWMQARAWAAALLCLHCPLCVGLGVVAGWVGGWALQQLWWAGQREGGNGVGAPLASGTAHHLSTPALVLSQLPLPLPSDPHPSAPAHAPHPPNPCGCCRTLCP
jgi:hypothetical protein